MTDPYLDPADGVLVNRLGLVDRPGLVAAEGELVLNRAVARRRGTTFDLDHLTGIHHWLFQDVYEWAGCLRTVDIQRGAVQFWPASLLAPRATKVFARLHAGPLLAPAGSPAADGRAVGAEEFLDALAGLYLDLNHLHPFRDGNGRAQRAFLADVAYCSDRFVDWRTLTRDANDRACEEAVTRQSTTALRTLLRPLILTRDAADVVPHGADLRTT